MPDGTPETVVTDVDGPHVARPVILRGLLVPRLGLRASPV